MAEVFNVFFRQFKQFPDDNARDGILRRFLFTVPGFRIRFGGRPAGGFTRLKLNMNQNVVLFYFT